MGLDFISTALSPSAFAPAVVQSKLQGREKVSFSSSLRMTDANLASCSGLKWFFQSPTTPNTKNTKTHTHQVVKENQVFGRNLKKKSNIFMETEDPPTYLITSHSRGCRRASPFLRNGDLSLSMYILGIRLKLDMLLTLMVLKEQCSAIFWMASSLRLRPRKSESFRRAAGRS